MKDYKEYNHEEIETIAEKFETNEFVNHEEMELWYDYKQSIKTYIHYGEEYFKKVNKAEEDFSEISRELFREQKEAEKELRWIRTIRTFPLEEFCKYYTFRNYEKEDRTTYVMAEKVATEKASDNEKAFIREIFEESETLKSINHFRDLTTPVHLRRWTYMQRNPTEYCPFVSSQDATQLYDFREHYVYIQSECTNHRWGDSYWISVDCDNTLYSLPVIKDFKNYDFQIGKFYKIKCEDEIRFGGNKKKYVMSIEESTEEEFMEKGLHQYMTRY